MHVLMTGLKKLLAAGAIIGMLSIAFMISIQAQTVPSDVIPTTVGQTACTNNMVCLNSIVQNTYQTLQRVNNLPNYLHNLNVLTQSWLTPDKSDTTSQMQAGFATLGAQIVAINNTQNSDQLQTQLAADLFANGDVTAFTTPPGYPKILRNMPYVNDLSFTSLLGKPLIPKAANAANAPYNYLKNASGININHLIPGVNWQGPRQDIDRYAIYYATTMAIQSFNGYVLSQLYADYQNGSLFTPTQMKLISQASSSSWIAEIASEELGKVLRQMLMFQSQTYVLLSQLIQTERQLLAAQVLNNSLTILSNQTDESIMVSKAQGIRPG